MTQLLKCLIPTIGSPRTLNGKEGRYELAAFYCELLGMKIVNEPWLLIADGSDTGFYIAFDGDGWNEQHPPRWPDPDYPQQMHLDVDAPDVVAAGERATDLGASLLQDSGEFRVFADPVGHPFCLYSNASTDKPAVSRLVFDCFSPRSLASFYEGFLKARGRVDDSAERVVVDLGGNLPDLAFQHAQFRAARWPDPAYPSQLHVDFRWHDSLTARYALKRAESLGAIRLPQVPGADIYADPASHPFCIQNEVPEVFEIAGLYLNPPEYAVVYRVDETGQGLPRAPSQPAQSTPGMPEPAADDDRCDLSGLLGALTVTDGVVGGSQDRTTEFQQFLTRVDANVPSHLAVNLVCDWEGTHESPAIQSWLAERPRFQVHGNPPGARWNEQAARWFACITDELTHRGHDADAHVLQADIRSWVRARNNGSKPFVWTSTTDQVP